MDWFRSGVRRNKETVLQAVGAHQATEDSAFERKYDAFKSYVLDLEHVSDSLQLYVESLDAYNSSLLCMGQAFKKLHNGNNSITGAVQYQVPSKMETVSDVFATVNKDVDISLGINVKSGVIVKCIEPILEILALVPAIDKKVAQRKQLLLDYDFYKAKLQQEHQHMANSQTNTLMRNSTRDAIAESYMRVETKLQETMKDLADLQIELEIEFEEFDGARATMLSNELGHFCANMYTYCMGSAALYSNMFNLLPGALPSVTEMVTQTGVSSVPPSVLAVQYKDKRSQNGTYCITSAVAIETDESFTTSRTDLENQTQTGGDIGLPALPNCGPAAKHNEESMPNPVSILSTSQQTFVKLQFLMHQQLMIKVDKAEQIAAKMAESGSGSASGSGSESTDAPAVSSVGDQPVELLVADVSDPSEDAEISGGNAVQEASPGDIDAALREATDVRPSALLKPYVVYGSIARPPVLGGSTGGYELLPSMYEQKKSRNSISRTPAAGAGVGAEAESQIPAAQPPPLVPKKPRVVLRTSITGATVTDLAALGAESVAVSTEDSRDTE